MSPESVKKPPSVTAKPSPKKKAAARTPALALDLEAELRALPAAAAETAPSTPVNALLLEAASVSDAALQHRAKLVKLPFDHGLISKLPLYLEALRGAEADWRRQRSRRPDQQLAALRKEAENLRADLMASGRYLLRKDAAAQAELDLIAGGEGLADLVEDLHALVAFGRAHSVAFAAALLPGGTETALARATELANTLTAGASAEAADIASQQALARRNRCAALVAEAVSEIRAAARYALRRTPESLAPFRSAYEAQNRRRARRKKTAAAPASSPTPA